MKLWNFMPMQCPFALILLLRLLSFLEISGFLVKLKIVFIFLWIMNPEYCRFFLSCGKISINYCKKRNFCRNKKNWLFNKNERLEVVDPDPKRSNLHSDLESRSQPLCGRQYIFNFILREIHFPAITLICFHFFCTFVTLFILKLIGVFKVKRIYMIKVLPLRIGIKISNFIGL